MKQTNDLYLPLIRKWYDMTDAGIKTEDYREITPYWIKRLTKITYDKKFCSSEMVYNSMKSWSKQEFDDYFKDKIKQFDHNIMTLGYPKKGDPELADWHVECTKCDHKHEDVFINLEWLAKAFTIV